MASLEVDLDHNRNTDEKREANNVRRRQVVFELLCSDHGIDDPTLIEQLKQIADVTVIYNPEQQPHQSHYEMPRTVLYQAGQFGIIDYGRLNLLVSLPNRSREEAQAIDISNRRYRKARSAGLDHNPWKSFWTEETVSALTTWIDKRYFAD